MFECEFHVQSAEQHHQRVDQHICVGAELTDRVDTSSWRWWHRIRSHYRDVAEFNRWSVECGLYGYPYQCRVHGPLVHYNCSGECGAGRSEHHGCFGVQQYGHQCRSAVADQQRSGEHIQLEQRRITGRIDTDGWRSEWQYCTDHGHVQEYEQWSAEHCLHGYAYQCYRFLFGG